MAVRLGHGDLAPEGETLEWMRYALFERIEVTAPEVLDSLRSSVLPAVVEGEEDLWRPALRAWGRRYLLDEPWVYERVEETLLWWAGLELMKDEETLAWDSDGEPLDLVDREAELGRLRLTKPAPLDHWKPRPCPENPFVEGLLNSLTLPMWNPFTESKEAWLARTEQMCQAHVLLIERAALNPQLHQEIEAKRAQARGILQRAKKLQREPSPEEVQACARIVDEELSLIHI